MKKRSILAAFLLQLMLAKGLLAQKKPIDTSVFNNWPSASLPIISNDGKYLAYNIWMGWERAAHVVVQSIGSDWKLEIPDASGAVMTEDNRMLLCSRGRDTLSIVTMGGAVMENIAGVRSFKLIGKGAAERLVYLSGQPEKALVIRNLATGNRQSIPDVTAYLFSGDLKKLLMQVQPVKGEKASLYLADGDGGNRTMIWQGLGAGGFVFDATGNQLAFLVKDRQAKNAVWYYRGGSDSAILLLDDSARQMGKGLKIDLVCPEGFTRDGSRIWVMLKPAERARPASDVVSSDLWSYTDARLQSAQEVVMKGTSFISRPPTYVANLRIADRQLTRIQRDNEQMRINPATDLQLVTYCKGDEHEKKWNKAARPSSYLVNLDGERKRIGMERSVSSPGGKYLLGSDSLSRNIYSYEVGTGKLRNLTGKLPIPPFDKGYDANALPARRTLRLAAWLKDDAAALVYDEFDIWQIDPSGEKAPVNVTNGYGRRHRIDFKLAAKYLDRQADSREELLLAAFDHTSRDNGFFRKRLGTGGDPSLLTMGPYLYCAPDHHHLAHTLPVKARDAEEYLVVRQTASESPNIFLTKDFHSFQQISHINPEKGYNWLTTELVTWKSPDGNTLQGILYKPEDFDPTKKYPLILHYYEQMSEGLHVYERPETISDYINIPLFVSRGYLVLTPDIHYKIGHPGRSACGAIESAARHMMKLPWVDAARIGIQGHSWGGYETLYTVTHSHLFAAAMASSGYADCISEYNSLALGEGFSKQYFYEIHQSRMGPSLWERPDLYVENSPIFSADKVTTPLLMMNNKLDGIIAVAQGVEMFTALRRLGKRAWMLQYDGEAHSLIAERPKMDYTVRMMQFFDHYLKGAPAPIWMTRGVPAKRKGFEYGYAPDLSVPTPGPGLPGGKPAVENSIK